MLFRNMQIVSVQGKHLNKWANKPDAWLVCKLKVNIMDNSRHKNLIFRIL